MSVWLKGDKSCWLVHCLFIRVHQKPGEGFSEPEIEQCSGWHRQVCCRLEEECCMLEVLLPTHLACLEGTVWWVRLD